MTNDFERRFFDALDDKFKAQDKRLDRQDRELEKILNQAQKTNGRVTKLEGTSENHATAIRKLETVRGKKLNIPTNILYLIALGAVIILLIVANLMGVNLKGIV